jgi:hypothetical protein
MIRSRGKESLEFDFRHERGSLCGNQPVMGGCIPALGLFVSATEDGTQGSRERLVFETEDDIQAMEDLVFEMGHGTQGSNERLVFGMVREIQGSLEWFVFEMVHGIQDSY